MSSVQSMVNSVGRVVNVFNSNIQVSHAESTPRYATILLQNVRDPAMIYKALPKIAVALGKNASRLRFGYPYKSIPNTAYIETAYDDFVPFEVVSCASDIYHHQPGMTWTNAMDRVLLGMGIEPVFFDLNTDSHLLIGGSTGSGKSVLLHDIISYMVSHMFGVTVALIDPKNVESGRYEAYVGSEAIDTVIAGLGSGYDKLQKIMEYLGKLLYVIHTRYIIYKRCGVRSISEFRKFAIGDAPPMPYISSGNVEEFRNVFKDYPKFLELITPGIHNDVQTAALCRRIVLIVDEVADLLMSIEHVQIKRELVRRLTRIAQKGRAAGVHLILTTQRPEVKIIPGSLKANLPARCALAVASKADSSIILDRVGAESLEGKGDAMFSVNGALPVRFQCPLVGDNDNKILAASHLGIPMGLASIMG